MRGDIQWKNQIIFFSRKVAPFFSNIKKLITQIACDHLAATGQLVNQNFCESIVILI